MSDREMIGSVTNLVHVTDQGPGFEVKYGVAIWGPVANAVVRLLRSAAAEKRLRKRGEKAV